MAWRGSVGIDRRESQNESPAPFSLPNAFFDSFASSPITRIVRPMDFYCAEVLTGRVAVERVAETEAVLAFHHTQPYWPVHIVIIPKRHIASLAAVAPEDLEVVQEMWETAAGLCREVCAQHGGCRLSTNCGDYQTTPHLHFYIHHGERLRNEDGSRVGG